MRRKEQQREINLLKEAFNADYTGRCVFDKTRKIIIINKSALGIIGKGNKSGIIGSDILDILKFIPKNDLISKTWKNYIDDKINASDFSKTKTRDYDLFINDKQTPVELEVKKLPGEETLFLLNIKDIGEEFQKRKAQDEFVSVVGHEMRTPISSLNGYLDLATNDSLAKIDERARNYLNLARESSDRLNIIFKDILDVSRIDSGKTTITPEVIDLDEFIKEKESSYKKTVSEKDQSLEIITKGTNLYCKVDRIMLDNILSHIIENSVKYTEKGGKITITTWYENEKTKISIADTGIGIEAKEIDKIFRKFYRSEQVTVRENGTGLGLFIVKSQTELMGGSIDVESKLGKGTTFTLSFNATTPDFLEKSYDKIQKSRITVLTAEEIDALDPFKEDMAKTIKYPKMDNNIFINNYVKTSKEWLKGSALSTPIEEKQKIKDTYRKFNSELSEKDFNNFWRKIENRLDNTGTARVAKMMVSKFIFPWAYLSPQSAAWETSFGWGMDFGGKWQKIPKSDPAYWMALRTPGLVWTRERTILSRYEISNKNSVLFIKAGCLPTLRYYKGGNLPKEIIACEDDVTVPLNSIFGWDPVTHGVEYHRDETYSFLDELESRGKKFDSIVMLSGSCQYHDTLDKLIPAVVKFLNPGGTFMFDIQPKTWDMDFSIYVLGVTYPNANTIPKNIDEVVLNVIKICEHLPGMEMKYHVDSRNEFPSGVMFYIKNTNPPK